MLNDNPYCELVKRDDYTAEDFGDFLHHVGTCDDCTRRIYSRIIIKYRQRISGDK
jgi:hypothetical protein